MNIHIHWHKIILTIFTIFPGIVIVAQSYLPKLKKLKSNVQYTLALLIICIWNAIVWDTIQSFVIIFVAGWSIILIEYLSNEKNKFDIGKVKYELKVVSIPIFIMVVCPVCEEYIYRFFLYKNILYMCNQIWIYAIISVLAFVFCHFATQELKALYKLPFAIIETFVFLYFKNIELCIVLHMFFNIYVYSHNIGRYIQGRHYDKNE